MRKISNKAALVLMRKLKEDINMTYGMLKNNFGHLFIKQPRLSDHLQSQNPQINILLKQNAPLLIAASLLMVYVMIAPTFGVSVDTLKAPIQDLKSSLFGGWMWIAKIGAAVGGCVMAVYQRDIVPLATGAAIGLGIHFYDGYFGDVTEAALI